MFKKFNDVDKNGNNGLIYAVKNNNIELVRYLTSSTNIKINILTKDGFTPLQIAAEKGNFDIVCLLVHHGANVNKSTKTGFPIHAAIRGRNVKVVEFLLESGADISAKYDDNTPMQLAVIHGGKNDQVYKALRDWSRKVRTYFTEAASFIEGNLLADLQELLFQHICVIYVSENYQTKRGVEEMTLLGLAVDKQRLKIVGELLESGADINQRDTRGRTALHIACENADTQSVCYLIQKRANVNSAALNGVTPLHCAAANDNLDIINLLLKNNANVNASTDKGITPLFLAIFNNRKKIFDCLINNGARLTDKMFNGETALHLAAERNLTEMITMILDTKVIDINTRDDNGATPLLIATAMNSTMSIRLLLTRGADPNIPNKCGAIPIGVAIDNGNKEAIISLKSRQVKMNELGEERINKMRSLIGS